MTEVTFVICRAYVLDGIEYVLSVYDGPTGFTGFWGCPKCRDEGGVEKRADSREDAIARCTEAIERHHAEKHRERQPCPVI